MKRLVISLALALWALPLLAAGGPATLEGNWRLAEQYYGEGEFNFHGSGEGALGIVFRPEEGRLLGTVTWEGGEAPWPAYPTPAGAAHLGAVEARVAPDMRSAFARYRVPPAPGDDTTLLVEESWRLDQEGRLLCDVKVRFEREGRTRGGFTWHRVYRREGSR